MNWSYNEVSTLYSIWLLTALWTKSYSTETVAYLPHQHDSPAYDIVNSYVAHARSMPNKLLHVDLCQFPLWCMAAEKNMMRVSNQLRSAYDTRRIWSIKLTCLSNLESIQQSETASITIHVHINCSMHNDVCIMQHMHFYQSHPFAILEFK